MSARACDARALAGLLVSDGRGEVEDAAIMSLARTMRSVSFAKGAPLYRSGELVPAVWFLREGLVEISARAGRAKTVIYIAHPGEIVGDVYVLQRTLPPYTARCIDDSLFWFLPEDELHRLLSTFPSLAAAWACSLAARLSRTRNRIAGTLSGSLEERLIRILLSEAGEDAVVNLPQNTLAESLGVQRTSANKVLKSLETRGLIHLMYGKVHLRDVLRLRRLVDSEAPIPPISSEAHARAGALQAPPQPN